MTKNAIYTIEQNTPIAKDVYCMRLLGPTSALHSPGQFVNVQLAGFYLRRPISVCSWGPDSLSIIYKILGKGTARMAALRAGETLDLLVGLGNGFSVQPGLGQKVVLVGGGVGVPPLYGLAQSLVRQGTVPTVVMGYASAPDVFYQKEFEALGCPVAVATMDGTAGEAGLVTGPLQKLPYNYYYACGPQAMLRAVYGLGQQKGAVGQLSFEERMGCGFGACMGCSCHTLVGPKRVCLDGPVFSSQEVLFA
ncbi:MAG: dihydroorotate dehydrogenase electron transfer subunit [Oscillospiraceae bacterium]